MNWMPAPGRTQSWGWTDHGRTFKRYERTHRSHWTPSCNLCMACAHSLLKLSTRSKVCKWSIPWNSRCGSSRKEEKPSEARVAKSFFVAIKPRWEHITTRVGLSTKQNTVTNSHTHVIYSICASHVVHLANKNLTSLGIYCSVQCTNSVVHYALLMVVIHWGLTPQP